MLPSVDAAPGQVFQFRGINEGFAGRFVKFKSNGDLVFDRLDVKQRHYLDRQAYILAHNIGLIVRLNENDVHGSSPAIEPAAFEPISEKDSPKLIARKRKYLKAVTQQYYIQCIDILGLSRSDPALRAFIESHKETHQKLALGRAPGASTLIDLYRKSGKPGYRPLHLFLNGSGGDQKSRLWERRILDLKAAMVAAYWSDNAPKDHSVIKWFKGEVAEERKRRGSTQSLHAPSDSTLKNWIEAAATPENVARREGRKVANRQLEGVHSHVQALRPLQCVVLDHTQIDMHIVILNARGVIVERYDRPWLIVVIDVYSRMILAANLTVEAPSIYTLMAGLKQTIKPKEFLEHYNISTAYGWAIDGWGKFRRALVDNGLENIGRSLRSTAQAIELDVSFAAVKTPEYKAVGERFFETLNVEIWHEADGAVSTKSGKMDKDPREDAFFTLQEAQELLWNWIVTVYHLRPHGELGIAPARKWSEAFKDYTRPMVDDMNAVENVFGRSITRQLTTKGVYYDNERFHHPELTTSLLHDLYYLNTKRRTAENKNQSIAVNVEMIVFDQDVSNVAIYNPIRRSYVRVPNRDPRASGSYDQRRARRALEYQENDTWFPFDEIAINEARHAASLTRRSVPSVPEDPSAASKHAAVDVDQPAHSSPRRLPVHERGENKPPRKVGRRGEYKAKHTRQQTKKREKAEAHSRAAAAFPTEEFEIDAADVAANVAVLHTADSFEVTDPEAFRQSLKAKLKLSGRGS